MLLSKKMVMIAKDKRIRISWNFGVLYTDNSCITAKEVAVVLMVENNEENNSQNFFSPVSSWSCVLEEILWVFLAQEQIMANFR